MLLLSELISVSGRWIPSKMAPMIPGPSSTERGFPVPRTGSPTHTPAVARSQGKQNKLQPLWTLVLSTNTDAVSVLTPTTFYSLL